MLYWTGYIFFTLFSWLCFPRRIIGRENIPTHGSFIIASNHVSNLDPFIIGITFRRRVCFVAKEELFKNKVLGFVLSHWGAFPIRRNTADFRALRETLRRLKAGFPVVIFPEGTRKALKRKDEPESGIGFLAVKGGVPVIPVYVQDSDKVLPPGQKFPRRHTVTLYFGRAVTCSNGEPYPQIAERIMQQINALPV